MKFGLANNVTSRRRRTRGSVMVEFAAGSAVMLSLFAGTFEFGLTFYRYNTLYNAARNGAQYGATRSLHTPDGAMSSAYRQAVVNMVVYGSSDPQSGAVPLVPGLTPDKVTVEMTTDHNVPSVVTVRINNFSVDAVFRTHNFSNKPVISFPFVGRWEPDYE